MDIKFDDYSINKSDFDFFQSLPKEEKILFIYDLICEQAYGTGSDVELQDFTDIEIDQDLSIESITTSTIQHNLSDLVDSVTDVELDFNILLLNNFIVINSINEDILLEEVFNMFYAGYLMKKLPIKENTRKIFQKQQCCEIYEIFGKEYEFNEN